MRGTQRFAKAAFDAAIDDILGRWHGLEMLQVGRRIVIQYDSRIQSVFRIEQFLDTTHQIGSLPAPLHFDKGRHVAPGAVFGLERAVVLVDDQLADFVHEARVPCNFGRIAKILGKHEMQIALQRMSKDDRLVVTVVSEQRLQIKCGRCQRFDRKSHILDDDRGACPPHGSD